MCHTDRKKTSFSSPFRQFQLVKLPFGLTKAPATYSWLVMKALRHLQSSEAFCYLDDTVLHPADAWAHLPILRRVSAVFLAAGLQISPENTQLFRDSIKYLDHEVSSKLIRIPPVYTSIVQDWPIPETLKALPAFLRKCRYYITDSLQITHLYPHPWSNTHNRNKMIIFPI